jgi:hypothetical protein
LICDGPAVTREPGTVPDIKGVVVPDISGLATPG